MSFIFLHVPLFVVVILYFNEFSTFLDIMCKSPYDKSTNVREKKYKSSTSLKRFSKGKDYLVNYKENILRLHCPFTSSSCILCQSLILYRLCREAVVPVWDFLDQVSIR